MKKPIIFFAFAFILAIGCNNSANNNKNTDSLQAAKNNALSDETANKEVSLEEIVGDNKLIMKQINGIKELKSKKTKVLSFAEYENVFKMRENLIFLFKKDEKLIKCLKECEDLHQELSEFGILAYSEKGENPGFYRDAFPSSIVDRVVLTLEDLVRDKKLIMEQLNNVKKIKANSSKIKSIAEVEKTLKMRDSLIFLLQNDEKFNNFMRGTIWQKLENELKALGINIIQAEGLFYNIIKGPFLDNVIEKVADEPYILRNKIQNLFGETLSGEYPYGNIQEEMEIVFLSEKMVSKYPGHQYNKEIMGIYSGALKTLTDIHKYTSELVTMPGNKFAGYQDEYLIGNYDSEYYNAITDTFNHKEYIKKYPKSRFTKIIKNILSNISSITTGYKILYIVQVPALTSDSVFANEKLKQEFNNLPKEIVDQSNCFKYMWLGIDIPHELHLGNGNKMTAYRFFDKKEPAEKSLKIIQKIIPSAKLVEYKIPETDKEK
jgi:hypothetical protein